MTNSLKINTDNDGVPLIDKVLNVLEKSIIRGEIGPGERLSEASLAKKMGISRVPVREALIRLEEANVVKKTYQGREIVKRTNKDLEDLYEIKILLEVHGATKGCLSSKKQIIDRLDDLVLKMENLFQEGNSLKIQQVNQQFHNLLVKSSNNEKLYNIYLNTAKQIRWTTSLSVSNFEILPLAIKEHSEILQAFKDSDCNKLAGLIKTHGERFQRSISSVKHSV
ncbi:MAG: GntR family transcriptional regulator [Proteobacteria bacterium]|nr:GntR family transcriptional regulator [Pseudomonadota bacterium]